MIAMRGSRKFCQRGSSSDNVFMRGEMIQIALTACHHRPVSKRHLNGVSLAGRWWPYIEFWLGSFVIFQGIRTSIAIKNPIFLRVFSGSRPHAHPSGSAHNCKTRKNIKNVIIMQEPHVDAFSSIEIKIISNIYAFVWIKIFGLRIY